MVSSSPLPQGYPFSVFPFYASIPSWERLACAMMRGFFPISTAAVCPSNSPEPAATETPSKEAVVSDALDCNTQINFLSDFVLDLAQKVESNSQEMARLFSSLQGINKIKSSLAPTPLDKATEALELLRQRDPESFRRVVRHYSTSIGE